MRKRDLQNYIHLDPETYPNNFRPWEWIKSISTLIIVCVISYKIYETPMVFTVDFPTFLSLLLAVFAVALSALFYFKATENSNAFYDNTYKFTGEVSKLLAEIKSGFGEKLRNMEESYTKISGYMENSPKLSETIVEQQEKKDKETEKKIEDEKKTVERVEKERDRIIKIMLDESKLLQPKKEELSNQLEETKKELHSKHIEIDRMKRQLEQSNVHDSEIRNRVSNFTLANVIPALSPKFFHRSAGMILKSLSSLIIEGDFPEEYLNDLASLGYRRNRFLTLSGIKFFKNQAKILRSLNDEDEDT